MDLEGSPPPPCRCGGSGRRSVDGASYEDAVRELSRVAGAASLGNFLQRPSVHASRGDRESESAALDARSPAEERRGPLRGLRALQKVHHAEERSDGELPAAVQDLLASSLMSSSARTGRKQRSAGKLGLQQCLSSELLLDDASDDEAQAASTIAADGGAGRRARCQRRVVRLLLAAVCLLRLLDQLGAGPCSRLKGSPRGCP